MVQFSSIKSLIHVKLFVTPWITARQSSLSITNSQSLLKLMSIESVMPSKHLILCHPLLYLPSVFPSISVFSSESALSVRWSKYWSFSFSISPSNNIHDWFPLGWTGWISLQSKGLSRVFSNTAVQKPLPYRLPLTLSRVPCPMCGRSLLAIHLKYSSLHVDHKLPAYPFPHPSPQTFPLLSAFS